LSRTIRVDVLSPASVDGAVTELRKYREWVKRKAEELQNRAAEFLKIAAQSGFDTGIADTWIGEANIPGSVQVETEPNGNVTLVVAYGEDAVFMEFGAGVYYNTPVGTSPNPLASQNSLPFTIGSYSAFRPNKTVWRYFDEVGKKHISRGTPASMPMYNATRLLIDNIADIAREVFST